VETCVSSVHKDNVNWQNEVPLVSAFHYKEMFWVRIVTSMSISFLDGHWGYKFVLLSTNSRMLYSVMLTYTAAA